jgi:hypothetical protein
MKTKATIRSLIPTVAALCGLALGVSAMPARGQWGGPPPPLRYQHYYQSYIPAQTDTFNRIPYPIPSAPYFYYYYDPVNRSYPFTPDPIWRAMFPGIREHLRAEERAFGTPGETANELAYWRWLRQRAQSGSTGK